MRKIPSYALESIVQAVAAIEDVALKAPLRAAQVDLPVPQNVQDFYYQNTGDFMNGCQISFLSNLALTYGLNYVSEWTERRLSEQNFLRKTVAKVAQNDHLINIICGSIAIAAVVVEETKGYFSRPDLKDIPMGVAGALLHMGLRYCSIRKGNLGGDAAHHYL